MRAFSSRIRGRKALLLDDLLIQAVPSRPCRNTLRSAQPAIEALDCRAGTGRARGRHRAAIAASAAARRRSRSRFDGRELRELPELWRRRIASATAQRSQMPLDRRAAASLRASRRRFALRARAARSDATIDRASPSKSQSSSIEQIDAIAEMHDQRSRVRCATGEPSPSRSISGRHAAS